MLTLYFSPGSSAMATHIALHEVGRLSRRDRRRYTQNVHRSPEYLAINAEGKVPTLVIDGRPLTEVAATLWYLARRYPSAGLLPQQGDIEAEVISWMSFIASTVHPARRIGADRWREAFEIAEQRVGSQDWTVERYSIADIHLFRLFWRYVTTVHPDPAAFPGLMAHYQRMVARHAVQRTLEIAAIGYNLSGPGETRGWPEPAQP